MNKELETLRQIKELAEPRHLFVLPDWADANEIDDLIREGYLTCEHQQRDDKGTLLLAMRLELTPKGNALLDSKGKGGWRQLALKGSLAGASFVVMSVVILYVG